MADGGGGDPLDAICGPGKSMCFSSAEGLAEFTMDCMGMKGYLGKFKTMDPEKTTVSGKFPKQCYSYARTMTGVRKSGYYAEGLAVLKSMPFFPVWHAWYMPDAEHVDDGTVVDKDAARKGLLVPAAKFNEYMADADFRKRYEIYTEMPFHRACVELGRETPWIDVQGTLTGGRRPIAHISRARGGFSVDLPGTRVHILPVHMH